MNHLEDHVGTLLEDAAARITVHPDLTSVVDSTTAYPRLIERPRSHVVPIALLAAASITAVAVGTAVLVPARVDRGAQPSVAAPAVDPVYRNHADVYPLLTDVPAWAGTMTPTLQRAATSDQSRVWALVARRGSDSLIDPIIVSTGDRPRLDPADGSPIGDVGGAPAYLFEDDGGRRTALLASDTDGGDVTVSGMADADVVTAVLRGLTRIVADSSTTFSIGSLPTGYDVIIEPTIQPQAVDSFGIATSSDNGSDGSLSIQVVTDLSDLRFYSARQGAPMLRSIFLGGTDEQLTGWYAMPTDDSVVMVWTLDPGIVLVLTATRSNITASEAIAIAKDVVLTDRNTWSQTYHADAVLASADSAG
jgi:hypothetical protein